MAENPAVEADLIARSLRPLTAEQAAWGTIKLADAFDQLVVLRPSIAAYMDANPGDARYYRLVTQVVCAMVNRVLSNPDGKYQEAGDDYSYTLDSTVSTGSLYPTDAELLLLDVDDTSASGAFTVKPFSSHGLRAWDAEVGLL